MNSMHEFVVLRLAPNPMRGELLNVGAAVFYTDRTPTVHIMAPLGKLRAIDATWSSAKLQSWKASVENALKAERTTQQHVLMLSRLGYCAEGEPGLFYAENANQFHAELSDIKRTYVTPIGDVTHQKRERRTRLSMELRQRFKALKVLGKSVEDLSEHLIVPNVPVPEYPDLKADFVYKNGVYRVTQTLDYRVSLQGAHAKINEACVKSMAAELATKAWGNDTVKLAVVQIPREFEDLADGHIDMLYAHGFEIFHADSQVDMARYVTRAIGDQAAGTLI